MEPVEVTIHVYICPDEFYFDIYRPFQQCHQYASGYDYYECNQDNLLVKKWGYSTSDCSDLPRGVVVYEDEHNATILCPTPNIYYAYSSDTCQP